MNWHSGADFEAFSCPAYGPSSTIGTGSGTQYAYEHQQSTPWGASEEGNVGATYGPSSTEIPLLNDDQEKAILSDLCDQTVGESTPLSTFSYISEYICSNNIDIWPGEVSSVGGTSAGSSCGSVDPKASEQRSYPSSSCVHQQLFVRCKRVLESIIARNEQILELLRQKQYQPTAHKRRQ